MIMAIMITTKATKVMDDFLLRALAGGIGVALVAGPLGCFIVWRRMAYFGDTLAHSALLGVALGFVMGINLTVGIVACAGLLAVLLVLLQNQRHLATDTLLGIMAHSGLAVGLVVLSFFESVRVDLLSYLFGDVLAVTTTDLVWIYAVAALGLLILLAIWRPLLMVTIQEDLARAEGVPVIALRLAFVLLLATVIAIAMKVVGIMLIVSLLIIPAATARRFARTPEQMALGAALAGVVAVVAGLGGSLTWDTPSGPSVVVAAMLLFAVVQTGGLVLARD